MIQRFLSHPHIRTHLHQGIKFILCGLTGAFVEFSVVYVLVEHAAFDPRIAYIPSGLLSVTFVFFFNRYVTFRNRGRDYAAQTVRFIVVYSMAFLLNYLLANIFFRIGSLYLAMSVVRIALLAKALAIGIIAFVNYSLSHGFIFRTTPEIELPL